MNLEAIKEIEQAFHIELPEDYQQILLAYPEEILDAREWHLSDNVAWLIGQNRYVREDSTNFYGKSAWQLEHFIVGEDGNGNCFYLNLKNREASRIYFLDHEKPDENDVEIASCFAEWIPLVRAQLHEYQKNAEQQQENAKRISEMAKKP